MTEKCSEEGVISRRDFVAATGAPPRLSEALLQRRGHQLLLHHQTKSAAWMR